MTDIQLLDSIKKIIDTCFATGLVKSLEDSRQLAALYEALHSRLSTNN